MNDTYATQVYREISDANPSLIEWLDLRDQCWYVKGPDGEQRIFIDNDLPRDSDITIQILDNTTGFALFDHDGNYVQGYETLAGALKGQANAKIVVTAEVDLEDDEA